MSKGQRVTGDGGELVRRVVGAVPDWVNTMIHLNGLIADRMNVVPTDFQCLHVVVHDGPTTTGRIAQRVALTPGSVSRAVDRLEAASCVRRSPDRGDRRRTLIEATGEGLATITGYYAGLTERTMDALTGFSHDELVAVLRFLEVGRAAAVVEVEHLRGQS